MHCTPVRRGLDRSRALAPRSPARLARSNDPHPVQCNGIGTFPGRSRGGGCRGGVPLLALYAIAVSRTTTPQEGVKTLSLCARPPPRNASARKREGVEGVASTSTPCTSVADVDELSRRVVGDLKLGGRSIIEPNLRSDRDRDTFHSLFPGNIQVKSSLFGRKKRSAIPSDYTYMRISICRQDISRSTILASARFNQMM